MKYIHYIFSIKEMKN